MTEFRRAARYHQARWREANGHPIGSQPIAPRSDSEAVRLVGSRVPLAYGRATGANFVTAAALDAASARSSITERHQSFDHQRLWADLLSSAAMSFNLFGDLAADLELADRAVHTWWPESTRVAPGAGAGTSWSTLRGNSDFAGGCARSGELLVDHATFASMTLEELVDVDALPVSTAAAVRRRYVLG